MILNSIHCIICTTIDIVLKNFGSNLLALYSCFYRSFSLHRAVNIFLIQYEDSHHDDLETFQFDQIQEHYPPRKVLNWKVVVLFVVLGAHVSVCNPINGVGLCKVVGPTL